MSYAEVAVNSPLAQPRTFSYSIPPDMSISAGQAVWVPFGPRLVQGIVFEVSAEPSVEETKEIGELIDTRPVLWPHQVELARWIGEHYLCPLFEAAALMLPPGFERRMLIFVQPAPNSSETAISSLTPRQQDVLNFLQKKGRAELRELKRAFKRDGTEAIIDQLVRKGVVTRFQELERAKVSPKVERYLSLALGADQLGKAVAAAEGRRAWQQAKLLKYLAAEPQPIPLSRVRRLPGFSPSVVQALGREGLISSAEVRVQRDPLAHLSFDQVAPPALTPAQEAAWRRIRACLVGRASGSLRGNGRPPVFLVHGVTGSGKTELYLRALAQAIALGKRGIVLVPEIALTPQTISRFAARFPGRVAVLHSKLSLGEQFDEWQRIRDGAFDVVIGSRGAIFSPQPDLGLIVLDEEHEWSYKQQESVPRYHAREVAIKLAELTGSAVILGSATPEVVSYHQAQDGEYQLLELPQRIRRSGSESRLPQVEIVDLRQELKEGNRNIFSRSLKQALAEVLAAREQAILFLNRRGTASFVQCRDCGFVSRCRRCDVSLTYHSAEQGLICHQCNYRMTVPTTCPSCRGKRIRFFGLGTQRVEAEVGSVFPGARSLRWDRDATRGKHSHEEILARFLSHEADVLIGTQMIAKGLDLPLVTLVGVISADIGLHLPDFRSSERTFQLLTQVAGRAGRGEAVGRVIIQTYTPEHYAVVAAKAHDYRAFYEQELAFRRQSANPPFSRLARLLYPHTNAALCQKEAGRMYQALKQERDSWGLPDILLGPAPACRQRLRGRFRWQIVIRSPDPTRFLAKVPIPQGWTVDIDPVDLL